MGATWQNKPPKTRLTTRGRLVVAGSIIGLVFFVNHLLGLDKIDSDTGRPIQSGVIEQPFDGRQ